MLEARLDEQTGSVAAARPEIDCAGGYLRREAALRTPAAACKAPKMGDQMSA